MIDKARGRLKHDSMRGSDAIDDAVKVQDYLVCQSYWVQRRDMRVSGLVVCEPIVHVCSI